MSDEWMHIHTKEPELLPRLCVMTFLGYLSELRAHKLGTRTHTHTHGEERSIVGTGMT